MPDITMCSNKDCPSSHKCYRFRAIPSIWQSYEYFKLNQGRKTCKNFWAIGHRPIKEENS